MGISQNPTPYDHFFRAAISHRVAAEFLESDLADNLKKQVDLHSLKFVPGTFIDKELTQKFPSYGVFIEHKKRC